MFNASQFTATQFDDAAQKAKFANQFVKFALGGFAQKDFPKWFYTRLSMVCGHIAHFNQGGFYAEWFETAADCRRFLEHWIEYPNYGDAAFTYSDVEKVIKAWLRRDFDQLIEVIDKRHEAETAALNAERERKAAQADKTTQRFKVWRRSETTGTFGHRQYYVTAEDRSTWIIEIIPSNLDLKLNQFIDVPLVNGNPMWSRLYVEAPQRLKDCPEALMAEIWGTGK